ncbi:MAG TPA: hypothetical protein DCQ43_05825 [Treponema sp.]|nr:hypothetical protein [Treponema sp.]
MFGFCGKFINFLGVNNMSFNRSNEIDEEQIVAFLENALRRVETESDPDTLNKLKKLFKKTIPFSRRMYVAAFLTKNAAGHGRFNKGGSRFDRNERDNRFNRENRNGRNERPARDFSERTAERIERPQHESLPRVQIDPALATTIFIGIGRNRRVFPRDLVGLLVSVAGLERERIGEIRVLANYSFIQLFTEDCEKAISALNGYDYRGRKLSVSYSRQKGEEEAESETEESSEPVVSNESYGVSAAASESEKIAAEQTAFAAQQTSAPVQEEIPQAPYSETTDDGQVKSHFGNGEAY